MRGNCKHGNPLTNSCSFCKVDGKKHLSGRAIPGVGQPLPTLRCRKCGYSTVYQDALRRHARSCPGATRLTTEETARKLVDDLSNQPTGTRGGKSLTDRLASLLHRPKRDEVPAPKTPAPAVPKATDEIRLASAESYLSLLCAKLEIKTPFLFFADDMVNAGACGEAGQSTIWLHRQSTLTRDWLDVQRTIRHEVAHIVVHNTPGMEDAPAHGAEFDAVLVVVEKA